jgi:hypothetical protein
MKYLSVIVIALAINCGIPLSYANNEKHFSTQTQVADCGCAKNDKNKECSNKS